MTSLGIDLGGTKLSLAVFSTEGQINEKQTVPISKKGGEEVGKLMLEEMQQMIAKHPSIRSIGIAVPGIYRSKTGTVWAPNINGWDDYPLLEHMRAAVDVPVVIDSDRAAYILGESWMGNAKGCGNAIYLAVGTGIGAGILIDGEVLRGAHDIAGAIGWLALKPPFEPKYSSCGCFEYHASGDGIARVAREVLSTNNSYDGILKQKNPKELTSHDVFAAYESGDELAKEVFSVCIQFWGMAVANLVSLFNPEKIILGGGVFGPAVQFIPAIADEAKKWAQPISITKVSVEQSSLGADAGLYGAAFLAHLAVKKPAVQGEFEHRRKIQE